MVNVKKGASKKKGVSKKGKSKKKQSALMKFLNRDVSEFNTAVLVILSILFIAICGFISYYITNSFWV